MSAHHISVRHKPFGGTKGSPRRGTVVEVRCTCGRAIETGDDYGKVPLTEVESQLRRSLHQEREPALGSLPAEGEQTP